MSKLVVFFFAAAISLSVIQIILLTVLIFLKLKKAMQKTQVFHLYNEKENLYVGTSTYTYSYTYKPIPKIELSESVSKYNEKENVVYMPSVNSANNYDAAPAA